MSVTPEQLKASVDALMDIEDELDRKIQALQDERARVRAVFVKAIAPVQPGDDVIDGYSRRIRVTEVAIGMISRAGGVCFSYRGPRVMKNGALGMDVVAPYWHNIVKADA